MIASIVSLIISAVVIQRVRRAERCLAQAEERQAALALRLGLRVRVEISLAWWLRPYLACLTAFALIQGCEPDWNKLQRVVQRAIRQRVSVVT